MGMGMILVEDRGVENEDIEYLEVKGPSPCIEPSPITTTIRGDEEGSADTQHPYCCKLFVGATCVKIHIPRLDIARSRK